MHSRHNMHRQCSVWLRTRIQQHPTMAACLAGTVCISSENGRRAFASARFKLPAACHHYSHGYMKETCVNSSPKRLRRFGSHFMQLCFRRNVNGEFSRNNGAVM